MRMLSTEPMHLLVLLTTLCMCLAGVVAEYNVVDFGAKQGGTVDAAKAFLGAWASACGAAKPENIRVPKGKFLMSSVIFKGPCKNKAIKFMIDGTLVAPASSGGSDWIRFDRVEGVSIVGGTLDGRGSGLWECKTAGGGNCPRGDKVSSLQQGFACSVLNRKLEI